MEIILIVIAITLVVIAYKIPKKEKALYKKEPLVIDSLELLKGKEVEFTLKDASLQFGYVAQGRGTVVDVDSEWVLLSSIKRGKVTRKVVRISQISAVKGIRE